MASFPTSTRAAGTAFVVVRVVIIGDSLTHHGPNGVVALDDERLYPNRAARALSESLGRDVDVAVVSRAGWTARDAWWALTKDPHLYSFLMPRADALVLAVGTIDQLPSALPTYLRDGISYVRPGALRRAIRDRYHAAHPALVRATGRRIRSLPQAATDRYLSRCVGGVQAYFPWVTVFRLLPAPVRSAYYGDSARDHRAAVSATHAWAAVHKVDVIDCDAALETEWEHGEMNGDGMHWGWQSHRIVGGALANALTQVDTPALADR